MGRRSKTKESGIEEQVSVALPDGVIVSKIRKGEYVKPRNDAQRKLVELSATNDVVFSLGPAGTGKSYIAVALALKAVKEKKVEKIILTRPIVEAGERLGFLPGGLKEKIDPYLRPLYDCLEDMLSTEIVQKWIDQGLIELAPLAFMRGRTLSNAFIILDEAQNTTSQQMKMFLTRIGIGSKVIITGDFSQIDLPKGVDSGLKGIEEIVEGVKGIAVVRSSERDVVRHPIVAQLIKKYNMFNSLQ